MFGPPVHCNTVPVCQGQPDQVPADSSRICQLSWYSVVLNAPQTVGCLQIRAGCKYSDCLWVCRSIWECVLQLSPVCVHLWHARYA